jgi:hypothetical protein
MQRKRESTDTWTVRGVSPETRQATILAARRSGKKVGLFVDEVLRRAATEVLTGPAPVPAPRQEELLERILDRVETISSASSVLAERVAMLEHERTEHRSFLMRLFRRGGRSPAPPAP